MQQASNQVFNLEYLLHELKHFLPAQAPLKDFIHHNTLHAFQDKPFHQALQQASTIFGYTAYLSLREYRNLYENDRISKPVFNQVIKAKKGKENVVRWKERLLNENYATDHSPRIGILRYRWNKAYDFDIDSMVHPLLFRILCSYLDQGIAIWQFPGAAEGFLTAVRMVEEKSYTSFFHSDRARKLFLNEATTIQELLLLLVGTDSSLYEHYLFDQQFAHQGWSGMVSSIELQPVNLLHTRKIGLADLIFFELCLEVDALDTHHSKKWQPLDQLIGYKPIPLFTPTIFKELDEVYMLWQEIFEWSYYDQVLAGIRQKTKPIPNTEKKSFQVVFCIDDRSCSLRRYMEQLDSSCETFGTPGFFNVAFYYQPAEAQYYTKVCPAPLTPKHLIKETNGTAQVSKDAHFSKHSHSFYTGWIISQTLGFWSALKLFMNIFRPAMSAATASSFKHMNVDSTLAVLHEHETENGLQLGFTHAEMANRVEGLLKSIGMVDEFAALVYMVGHGASSSNNPHYAAYDCGACSGRAGSVNARVIAAMANNNKVRKLLSQNGIDIPDSTIFIGALHDTTIDKMVFYDLQELSSTQKAAHLENETMMLRALDLNAKERSRRFELVNSKTTPHKVHLQVMKRAVSLFEPRPELNHATNALCIVGRRALSKGLFLDRRSFLNSYDYRIDPEGKYLLQILNAAAPVCGGINLEYYFSRVDNQKLGAGSKLPHNVMGLFGVANGIDGDLRPGLPAQMVEIHDPVRLLLIVEQDPVVVKKVIETVPATYEWFKNEWVNLVVIDPKTLNCFRFEQGLFKPYHPLMNQLPTTHSIEPLIESDQENFPVYLIND
ncbi:MAG: DUF2309 domain-containing protein [Sphingobacteriia bacterium]|nr:MAG: DUF2309 domain-containing protein [Sphingobacteriia bacterium]